MAAPSRTLIERYRQLDETVERTAARINQRFGEGAYQPIILLRAHTSRPRSSATYRAADLCYVSSLHDGMNLVAKGICGCARRRARRAAAQPVHRRRARDVGGPGGQPYDLERSQRRHGASVGHAPEEQRERMRAMRAFLAEFNVYRWAGRMLMTRPACAARGTC